MFDADGNYLVKDNSVIKKAFVYKANSKNNDVIELMEIVLDNNTTPQKINLIMLLVPLKTV